MSVQLRSTVAAQHHPSPGIHALRRLHVTRFVFALAWAGALAATSGNLGLAAGLLLVLYPLADAAAAVADVRTSTDRDPALLLTIAISASAAIGLALAVTSGIPAALRVWGVWAIAAGLLQLAVALRRRVLGGQWVLIVSGGLSAVVGVGFVATAGRDGTTLSRVAGYAVLGGIFFLTSALRLRPGQNDVSVRSNLRGSAQLERRGE